MLVVYVRTPPSGEARAVELPPDARISDLQRAAADLIGKEPCSVALDFAGRPLDDPSATLADTGISAEAVVDLSAIDGWEEWLTWLGVKPTAVIDPDRPGVVNLSGRVGGVVADFVTNYFFLDFSGYRRSEFDSWSYDEHSSGRGSYAFACYAHYCLDINAYDLMRTADIVETPSEAEALPTIVEQWAVRTRRWRPREVDMSDTDQDDELLDELMQFPREVVLNAVPAAAEGWKRCGPHPEPELLGYHGTGGTARARAKGKAQAKAKAKAAVKATILICGRSCCPSSKGETMRTSSGA
eukprot:TRINITY_DN6539_c3_g1_i3.p1 TRINITY_DN6539_c3_g1~~TRINITY_DN6539_c3_g1_i3.p1  ORF type:complete len:323 (+),score=48.59 TRINITY_DN6539_c3_g1_i3:78-971(+)